MSIAVNPEWFSERYNCAVDALVNIAEASNDTISITTDTSATGKGYITAYHDLQAVIYSMLNIMIVDWNTAKACVNNLTHFDNYLGRVVNNLPINHMDYGNEALWSSADISNTGILPAGGGRSMQVGPCNFVSSETINELSVLSSKLDSMASSLETYSQTVSAVSGNQYFTGLTFYAIKNYLSSVHNPIAENLRRLCVTFSAMIRSYTELYRVSMPDDVYRFEIDHLELFRDKLDRSFNVLRDKMNELNMFIYSQNSQHAGLGLEDVKHYTIDHVEPFIRAQQATIDDILQIIENNEREGERNVFELDNDIDMFAEAASRLGMSDGYRMMSYNEDYSYISSITVEERHFDIYEFYFGLLTDGSGSQRTRAEEFLRADIRANLIESFQNRDVSYFHYNEYRGYDEDVLLSKIEGLDLSDKNFVRRWGELYHSMTADGYTDLRAIRYSEIAALFNREGILAYSGGQGDLDKIITTGIQRYVVDYAGYIADHDAYGYNQVDRWGENGDFDCSSLVIAAYEKAFIDLRFVMNQTRPEDDEWNYWHIGSNKLSTKPLDKYGFTIFTPNVDIKVTELVPGDVFAIDNDKANHVEVFEGRFERDGKVEYLNVSAHSSERIGGDDEYGNGRADCSGDQLHQWGPEGIRTHGLGTPWSTYIYETTLVREEDGSYNDKGDDVWGHDRIGEIRYENIGPRPEWGHSDDHITGCIKWPQHYQVFDENGNELPEQRDYIMEETPWSRIMRLENMEYWKKDH